MRRRASSLARLGAAVCLAAATRADAAHAQTGIATEGAPFLLLPIGARALALGQAVVADQPGTEAVWWNPAGLARAERREVAIHHYQSVIGTGDALSILVPSSLLGVITASVYILNFGEQPIQPASGPPIGSILPRNLVYAATYATPIGSRINAGLTFKVVQLRVDCTGACAGIPTGSASSSAIDAGAQYTMPGPVPIAIGAVVRHLGPRLQVKDREQADPLPTRIQIGAAYRVTPLERYAPDVDVRVSADVIDELGLESPSARFGADLGWRKRAHLRAGYVFKESENSEQYGPSLGLGVAAGNLFIDLGRLFDSFSSDVGQQPTYVSLRYLF
jgi:hypothetical protein